MINSIFGKEEISSKREYYWTDESKRISNIRIELKDEKRPIMNIGKNFKGKNIPYPKATKVVITRNPQNGDMLFDYFQYEIHLAQEVISGHTISKVSVQFL
jgi:hypothetical protein